jgi:hypothetical protein
MSAFKSINDQTEIEHNNCKLFHVGPFYSRKVQITNGRQPIIVLRTRLPPKYAPYMKEEDICRHCYRASLFKDIIDVKCVCCARPADDDDDCLMPMLECDCVDCYINNNTQDTRVAAERWCPFSELDCECVGCRINNNTLETDVEEDDDKEVLDMLLLYPDYSGSKGWTYISKKEQLWLSSEKWSKV